MDIESDIEENIFALSSPRTEDVETDPDTPPPSPDKVLSEKPG